MPTGYRLRSKGEKGISCDGEFWGKVKYVVSDREAVWGNIASYQTVDAELMKCSIEEYLKTKYWAKDIKVEISKIPLRL